MLNILLSKKIIITATIFLGGLVISVGLFISADLVSAQSGSSARVTQWTEPAGLGIAAPACSSASPSTTCVNNVARATLSWGFASDGITADHYCVSATVTVTGVGTFNNQPCNGTRTFNNLVSNKNYPYSVTFWDGSGNYQLGASSGSFTTPNCAPPPATPVLESVVTSCSANNPRNTLSWSVSDTAGINHYHIERCSGSSCTNFAQIDTKNVSPYVDTNVTQNTLYRYRVRSHDHNTNLFSSYSNTIGRTTADCTVPLPTVSAALTANKTSGSAPFNNVALTGTVSGTATGPMTYTFYCDSTNTSTNVVPGWTAQYSNINANPRTTNDAHRCDYPTAGTYRAKVIVEREGVFAQDRRNITVSTAPGPDLTAGASSPGVATAGLPVTLSASVSNIGTASTGAGFTNLFQRATSAGGAGATDIGTHVRGSALGTGNSINATLSYTFPSAGDYYVRVCADKSAATNNGVITELNENNNCGAWSSITVGTGVGSFNYNLSNSGTSSVTKGSGNVFTQNTITKTLTVSPTQSVTLSLSGVPNGTTYSISNSSCSPTCTSVITFTVSPSTNVGTYPITVTGSPLNKQTNFNLVISGSPMSVSCSANKGTALVGETVTWTATVSGGTQPLSYSWSGTSIPTSPAPSTNPFSIAYSTIGMKNTTVTVTDDASLQATCLSTIQVSFDPEFEEF